MTTGGPRAHTLSSSFSSLLFFFFSILTTAKLAMAHSEGQESGAEATTSFAVDVVRRLGSRLDAIQDKAEWAQSDDSKAVLQQQQQQQQLLTTSSDSAASEMAVVDVTNCTSLHSTKQLQVALQMTGKDELLNVARVTYAAYGIVLEQLLRDAERVNDQAWFWTQVEEDPSRTVVYLVQSKW